MAAMSVMGEAASMLQNAEELGNELSDNEGDLSIEQAARLVKLYKTFKSGYGNDVKFRIIRC